MSPKIPPQGGNQAEPPKRANTANAFHLDGANDLAHLRALAAQGSETPTGRDARATLARAEKALAAMADNESHPAGRWPANVILDESQAAALDEQSGNRPGNKGISGTHGGGRQSGIMGKRIQREYDFAGYGDTGGASRFFYVAKAPKRERPYYFHAGCECEEAWPVTASPARDTDETMSPASSSTSKSGNDTTVNPSLTDAKSTTSTAINSTTAQTTSSPSPPPNTSASIQGASYVTVNGGSGAACADNSSPSAAPTGISAVKAGPSMDDADPATSPEWSETDVCGKCGTPAKREAHATVKPLTLMRHLVRMHTPPGGIVLDPFAGSGATVEAAILEGFNVIAIEQHQPYIPMIELRITRATGGAA